MITATDKINMAEIKPFTMRELLSKNPGSAKMSVYINKKK